MTFGYNDLTDEQRAAVDAWETANNDDQQYDFQDNRRYAVVGNVEQATEYESIKDQGCCGFRDVELECSDGTTIWYGFNYGH